MALAPDCFAANGARIKKEPEREKRGQMVQAPRQDRQPGQDRQEYPAPALPTGLNHDNDQTTGTGSGSSGANPTKKLLTANCRRRGFRLQANEPPMPRTKLALGMVERRAVRLLILLLASGSMHLRVFFSRFFKFRSHHERWHRWVSRWVSVAGVYLWSAPAAVFEFPPRERRRSASSFWHLGRAGPVLPDWMRALVDLHLGVSKPGS